MAKSMNLLDQLFSKDFEIEEVVKTGEKDELGNDILLKDVITLKRQLTQSDYNDLSIISRREADDYIGEPKKQAQLTAQFSLLKSVIWKNEDIEIDNADFVEQIIIVRVLYNMIHSGLTDLKKK